MARSVFYSFHYKPDNWRAAKVRSIGAIDGNRPASDNDWETITGGGEAAIKRWIAGQMSGRSCTIVLIGANTAGRKWINYEIIESWNDGKGLVGIHIHNLEDSAGRQSAKGRNPFEGITVGGRPLSNIAQVYDPPYSTSKLVYGHIVSNLENWVEEAIRIRKAG
ncbi:MAG: TIR domain-containing protein [Phycisphaerae bacterium]|nr:TIR domain-containing protein [Phycisphaerae bacterium]